MPEQVLRKVHFHPPVFVGRQKHSNASSPTCVRLGIFMNTKVKKETVVPFRRIEHWLIVINSLWIGGMGLKGDHPNQT